MSYRIIVFVKQVPDTKNVTTNAMKADGTVNRSELPAIFNPEDLNALEVALGLKDKTDATVTVVTMGPPSAAEVLRESLYRGADRAILLTDRKFAGADTLATSLVLSLAADKLGYDLIIAGRQAIDGDTAQVGPQIAEKLKIPQATYVEEILDIQDGQFKLRKLIENGYEIISGNFPVLLTVVNTANKPRPPKSKLVMKYKKAKTQTELIKLDDDYITTQSLSDKGLIIEEWNLDNIGADPDKCGLKGSPTKVKKIDSVVLTKAETKLYSDSPEQISSIVKELLDEYSIG